MRYLAPFLRRPHTLTSAATALDRSPSTLAGWLPRFVATGLLEELAPVARAGMAMRRYRARARELAVPWRDLPLDRRVALLDEGRLRALRRFLDGLDEALITRPSGGLVFAAADEASGSGLAVRADQVPADPVWWSDAWLVCSLTPDRARALAAELDDLVARYTGSTEGALHVLHLGFAPVPRHRWRSAGDT